MDFRGSPDRHIGGSLDFMELHELAEQYVVPTAVADSLGIGPYELQRLCRAQRIKHLIRGGMPCGRPATRVRRGRHHALGDGPEQAPAFDHGFGALLRRPGRGEPPVLLGPCWRPAVWSGPPDGPSGPGWRHALTSSTFRRDPPPGRRADPAHDRRTSHGLARGGSRPSGLGRPRRTARQPAAFPRRRRRLAARQDCHPRRGARRRRSVSMAPARLCHPPGAERVRAALAYQKKREDDLRLERGDRAR